MDLAERLESARGAVVDAASESMKRAHLRDYESSGGDVTRRGLENLFSLVVSSLADRDLAPICHYATTLARTRFEAGFDVGEVQTAFNVLEEAIWHVFLPEVPQEDLAQAAGLIGTVLGAAKDAMTREWVSLAAGRHVPSVDLSALFQGT